jgi:hypothetical protein
LLTSILHVVLTLSFNLQICWFVVTKSRRMDMSLSMMASVWQSSLLLIIGKFMCYLGNFCSVLVINTNLGAVIASATRVLWSTSQATWNWITELSMPW